MAALTVSLGDYLLSLDTQIGTLVGLQRGDGPPLLGHGHGPAPLCADVAYRPLDAPPYYVAHTVEDNRLAVQIALGPLLLHDRFTLEDGGLIARRVAVENTSEEEVQLTGLRIGLAGVAIGDPAHCRFEAPGNAIRPRLPLAAAASLTPPPSGSPQRISGAQAEHFAPGAAHIWGRPFGDAPDIGPGLLIVHNAALGYSLLTWYVSSVEAARPWVSGDGTHAALGFDLWLAGWLAPGAKLEGGTQYLLACAGRYEEALAAYRACFERTGVLPPIYGRVDNATDWAGVYEVHPGPFGGFSGLRKALPNLAALGLDTLYLLPVYAHRNKRGLPWDENWWASGSPYAIHDFEQLEPSLGSEQDFADLIAAAHGLGMRVLMDLVLQGCSLEARYVQEHPDWFVRDERGQMVHSHGWNDTWSLDWANPAYQQYVTDYALRYVERFGVDGFRVDAPHGKEPNWDRRIPYHASRTNLGAASLLAELRRRLLAAKPSAALYCELFGPLWITSHDISNDYHPHAMAYALAEGRLTPAEFGEYLRDYWAILPQAADGTPSPRICFTETHDTRSYPAYAWRGSRISQALLGILVMAGFVPMIWCGQEVGQEGFIGGLLRARRGSIVLRRGVRLFNAVAVDDLGHYRREWGRPPAEEVFALPIHDGETALLGLVSLCPEQVTYRLSLPLDALPLERSKTYRLRDLISGEVWDECGRTRWTGAELANLTLTPRMYQPYILHIEPSEA